MHTLQDPSVILFQGAESWMTQVVTYQTQRSILTGNQLSDINTGAELP